MKVGVVATLEESVGWALTRPLTLEQPHQYCLLNKTPASPACPQSSVKGESAGRFIVD